MNKKKKKKNKPNEKQLPEELEDLEGYFVQFCWVRGLVGGGGPGGGGTGLGAPSTIRKKWASVGGTGALLDRTHAEGDSHRKASLSSWAKSLQ